MSKRDKTLKEILDLILYENPSTQDEIAEKLGITRRYVTQLLQPLVKEGTVKRAYMIDLKSYQNDLQISAKGPGRRDCPDPFFTICHYKNLLCNKRIVK